MLLARSAQADKVRTQILRQLDLVMPSWTPVPLDYESVPGSNDVFVRETSTFDARSLAKETPTRDRSRQGQFERLLEDIAWHLGSARVPVFISFNGDQRRMDKGCIGHAVAAKVLEQPVDGPEGYVTEVILATAESEAARRD
jgi:hypothetical protein